jgi:hypothetical protein
MDRATEVQSLSVASLKAILDERKVQWKGGIVERTDLIHKVLASDPQTRVATAESHRQQSAIIGTSLAHVWMTPQVASPGPQHSTNSWNRVAPQNVASPRPQHTQDTLSYPHSPWPQHSTLSQTSSNYSSTASWPELDVFSHVNNQHRVDGNLPNSRPSLSKIPTNINSILPRSVSMPENIVSNSGPDSIAPIVKDFLALNTIPPSIIHNTSTFSSLAIGSNSAQEILELEEGLFFQVFV